MLVLGRKKRQSVVIGDEVTVTVEEISDIGDGRRLIGATVRLGFETPRYVAICRSELQDRPPGAAGTARPVPRRQPGELVELPDAQVRLRIEVPGRVPVRHNGAPPIRRDSENRSDEPTAVYHLTCRKEDRIAICHNITIAALDFQRFVLSGRQEQKGTAVEEGKP